MENWIGLLLTPIALWLLVSAWRHRRRVLAERRAAEMDPGAAPLHASLSILADIMPPIVILGLVLMGGEIVLVYLMMQGSGMFSLLDLAGSLLLIGAYGYWLIIRTKYRPTLR